MSIIRRNSPHWAYVESIFGIPVASMFDYAELTLDGLVLREAGPPTFVTVEYETGAFAGIDVANPYVSLDVEMPIP